MLLGRTTKMGIKTIPEGCENIAPQLVVNGAAEAIDFYKKSIWSRRSILQSNPG
jgi:hypothetical protein